MVKKARDHFLPRSALAIEEHRRALALRQEPDLMGEVLHARRGAERVEPMPRGALHQQRLVDPAKPRLVGHPRQRGAVERDLALPGEKSRQSPNAYTRPANVVSQ